MFGWTPLLYAAKNAHETIVRFHLPRRALSVSLTVCNRPK